MIAVKSDSDSIPRLRGPWLREIGVAVAVIAAVKLVLHLCAGRQYGYLDDELYYLDCARRLAWGYVDQPPLIALVTWLERALLGDSLSAIRFLPALSGAAKILLTGLITRELGGGRFAQGLAALCVLLAPGLRRHSRWGKPKCDALLTKVAASFDGKLVIGRRFPRTPSPLGRQAAFAFARASW